ncbi:AraC family transcriptional regulator [Paenibacillus sp. 32352]|uniref:AraC family transcriptional regulator n=1 Tax=Paenibacillus sp. 32352 TaxID=1969111 RepID=UPI0009ADF48E|nr:AraC family transcriptional regulator [Paenibacillus sp. 32352]
MVLNMPKSVTRLLRHRLSSLRLDLIHAKYTDCPPDWIRRDFIPEYNKFYYIVDGCGSITVGGQTFLPEPGQLFFAPADVMQSFSVTNGPPYQMYWCHFTSNIAMGQLFQTFGLPNIVTVQDSGLLLKHFGQMMTNRGSQWPTSSLKIQSALFEILALFIDTALSDKSLTLPGLADSKLIDTIHYIDQNLSKEFTVDELSEIAHFHPNYFIRFFKMHLGVPPMRYIHERRLERAKELLSSTEMKISEIANMTGFYEASHFSTAFKKYTGTSPSAYRNR